MGCSGFRSPQTRLTTHPLVAETIINALLDCGAVVVFGDDVARSGKYCGAIHEATGMLDVAKKTGAKLIDFVTTGVREVRGGLHHPRNYLVTNAYFDADVVVNVANCRSHVGIGLSGAIKNMFGCVVGLRKQLIHNLFPGDPKSFGRTIADIYRTIPAQVSFLDLTTVAEGAGIRLNVRPVGLILGSTDAVALDTVAAHAIGFERLSIWPSHFGGLFGVGCNVIEDIIVSGLDWQQLSKLRLEYPYCAPEKIPGVYDHITTFLNHTLLRPRPVIDALACTGCGDCVQRCPVACIRPVSGGTYKIELSQCVDCGCCLKTCETGAAQLQFVGLAKALRVVMNASLQPVQPKAWNPLDPAPGG